MFAMGMVHAGEKSAGGGAALVAALGLAASYSLQNSGSGGGVPCTLRITFKRNGTWEITAVAGFNLTGTPITGSWASPNQAFVGDDHEIKIDSGAPTGGSITNQASSYVRLNQDRYFELTVTDFIVDASPANGNVTITQITIRRIGTITPTSEQVPNVDFSVSANRDS